MWNMLWIVLLFSVCSSDRLTIYNNARFQPNDIHFLLDTNTSVNSQLECTCLCYNNIMCLTATFSGVNQRCILYFARLDQGKVNIMATTEITSVLSF